MRGLYAGVSMGLLSVSHGSLQFVAYEHMKRYFQTRPDEKLVRKWLHLLVWHSGSGQGKRNFNGNVTTTSNLPWHTDRAHGRTCLRRARQRSLPRPARTPSNWCARGSRLARSAARCAKLSTALSSTHFLYYNAAGQWSNMSNRFSVGTRAFGDSTRGFR